MFQFTFFVFQAKSCATNNHRNGLSYISYLSPFIRDSKDVKNFRTTSKLSRKTGLKFFYFRPNFELISRACRLKIAYLCYLLFTFCFRVSSHFSAKTVFQLASLTFYFFVQIFLSHQKKNDSNLNTIELFFQDYGRNILCYPCCSTI